jgi:adenosine deaminase
MSSPLVAIPAEFIRRVPKTDLHVHLDGSLRLSTLIELARRRRVRLPSMTEEGLRARVFKDAYRDLPEYLAGFACTVAVMQDAESLERIACELAEDNLAEGVRYVEVRFAPQLHVRDGFSMEQVVRAVCRGLERAQRAHNRRPEVRRGGDLPFHFGVIVCALRYFNADMSETYRRFCQTMAYAPPKRIFAAASLELARAAVQLRYEQGLPVVGFDLAGAEAGYPADDHREAFQYAHSHFLKKTVHAGEAYGPESIFQAITLCYANRIGHGTWLFAHDMIHGAAARDPRAYVERLAEYIASERITIEVCLTSNLQTLPPLKTASRHSLRQMLERELSLSLCTDNRLVSHTSVTRELTLAASEIGVTPRQFRNLVLAGFKGSFFPGGYAEKRAFVRRVIDRYEALEAEWLPGERKGDDA